MAPPSHLFNSCDGSLYDTRAADWSTRRPLRRNYQTHPAKIEGLGDVKAALRQGGFAWPGGYPLYFVTRDGAALSFEAARQQFRQIADDWLSDSSTGWRVDGLQINYEDPDLFCDHTGKRIPCAYGESV